MTDLERAAMEWGAAADQLIELGKVFTGGSNEADRIRDAEERVLSAYRQLRAEMLKAKPQRYSHNAEGLK